MVSLIQFYRQKFQTLTKTIKYNHCTMSPQHRNITNEGVQYRYRFTKTQNPTSYRLTKQRERERERTSITSSSSRTTTTTTTSTVDCHVQNNKTTFSLKWYIKKQKSKITYSFIQYISSIVPFLHLHRKQYKSKSPPHNISGRASSSHTESSSFTSNSPILSLSKYIQISISSNGRRLSLHIFSSLRIEQIDQSLGVIRGEEHRVHRAAVCSARIAHREPAPFTARTTATARFIARRTKAVVQTARFETAITIVASVETKVPLVDRQADSRLAAASTLQ